MISFLNDKYAFNTSLILLARNIEVFKKEVPHLAAHPLISLIEQDVRNLSELPDHVNYVIHAATSPDNREHSSQPLRTIDTIYKGTYAVLDACTRLPALNKVLYISSNYVYGTIHNDKGSISEDETGISNCFSVNTAYGEAKRIAETICATFRNQFRLPIVVTRPFAFVGPYQYMEKPWAINNFMRDAILGSAIRILGNENTLRSYLYGSDAAFWILKMLISGKDGAVYNLGSDDAISLRQLAEKVAAHFYKKPDIIVRTSKENFGSSSVFLPDLSLVKRQLQLSQKITTNAAIEKTIAWYQNASK
jgi:dTDP-glucose 4,6-dehydratase